MKTDESEFYYKLKFIIAFIALAFFAIGDYDKANSIFLFLIFQNTIMKSV